MLPLHARRVLDDLVLRGAHLLPHALERGPCSRGVCAPPSEAARALVGGFGLALCNGQLVAKPGVIASADASGAPASSPRARAHIGNWSLGLDAKIVAMTIIAVQRRPDRR